MIEAILSLMAFCGFGMGSTDDPKHAYEAPKTEMIRAIDSDQLNGFENLETHEAEQWFV